MLFMPKKKQDKNIESNLRVCKYFMDAFVKLVTVHRTGKWPLVLCLT
jgi:hypothetical protein